MSGLGLDLVLGVSGLDLGLGLGWPGLDYNTGTNTGNTIDRTMLCI